MCTLQRNPCEIFRLLSYLMKTGFNRLQFQDEVKAFINAQLDVSRSDSSNDQCQKCIQNIKNEFLIIQDRMLRAGKAAVHASVQLVKNGAMWLMALG